MATANHGTIEISDDISSGSIRLGTGSNGGHSITLRLTNDARKYEGVFTPNDRIVVFLKRIRWLQVMSGYLNGVPMFAATAKTVSISASCTLKRLLYSLYDAGSPSFATLMNQGAADASGSVDSNMGQKIIDVLAHVGGWNPATIHIGAIPADWFQEIAKVYQAVEPVFSASIGLLVAGGSPISQGVSRGTSTGPGGTATGPGYGTLPATSGRVGALGDSGDPNTGVLDLTGESSLNPSDVWYCGMRWPYRVETTTDPAAAALTAQQKLDAVNWWASQRLLVMNTKTLKTICVRPAYWGPATTSNRVIDLSPQALTELGATSNDFVQIAFAPFHVETTASQLGQVTTTPLGVYIQPPSTPGPTVGPNTTSTGLPTSATSSLARLQPPSTTPTIPSETGANSTGFVGDAGVVFAARDNLKANTAAAADFTKLAWPAVPSIGGWRMSGSTPTSDHPLGLAIDISIGNGDSAEPTPDQVALGNSIAYWFTQNPLVFGSKYVIFNNMFYSPSGASRYIHPSDPNGTDLGLSHRNHVHVSFFDTGQTSMGASGSPWPVNTSDFSRVASIGGVVSTDRATSITAPDGSATVNGFTGPVQLITTTWTSVAETRSVNLTGPRQLLNDTPLQPLITQLTQAGMREYMSAPNGDFLAWWPDLFNFYGQSSQLVIQDVELGAFGIVWNDRPLVTHQFVVGATPIGQFLGNAPLSNTSDIQALREFYTRGIATIDFPEILRAVINVDPSDPSMAGWTDTAAIYKRFGARVNVQRLDWASTPEAEFWAAVHLFRMAWSQQFTAEIPVSFLPEAYPGMIAMIPSYGIQCYIDQVQHDFDLGPDGAGFSTSLTIKSPSTIGAQSRLLGLPKGGTWVGSKKVGG